MPSKRISKRRTRRNNRSYKKVVRRINRTKKKHTMRKQRINRRKYSNRKRTNRKRTNRKQVRGGAGNVPTAAALSQDQQEGFFTFKKVSFWPSKFSAKFGTRKTAYKKNWNPQLLLGWRWGRVGRHNVHGRREGKGGKPSQLWSNLGLVV